jgi:hypothetical protein
MVKRVNPTATVHETQVESYCTQSDRFGNRAFPDFSRPTLFSRHAVAERVLTGLVIPVPLPRLGPPDAEGPDT